MSITVADNFQYKGGKPLDARMKFASVNDMVATPAADLYDGCFAYVTATKKYYSYDSTNTSDPTLGKWKEYSAGAEYSDFTGATAQAAGAHGLVPAPTTGDISKFLKGDGTWATVPMPSFDYSNTSPEAMNFSTDEKVIGTWIDGKPLYQKTYDCGYLPNNSSITYTIDNFSSIERIVYMDTFATAIYPDVGGFTVPKINADVSIYVNTGGVFTVTSSADYTDRYLYITLRYTKTTDSPVASGEKIVGQWIDGKPLYQKTYSLNTVLPAANASPRSVNITLDGLSSIGIDNIIDMSIVAKGRDNYAGSWLNRGCGENLSGYISVDENKLQVFQKQTNDSNQFTVTSCTIWYTKTT